MLSSDARNIKCVHIYMHGEIGKQNSVLVEYVCIYCKCVGAAHTTKYYLKHFDV